MRKIVQRTRYFEKVFLRLSPKLKQKFIQQLQIFLEDEFDLRLKTHQLKGKLKNKWSFTLAYDVRAIYTKDVRGNKTVIIFTFVDVGSHSHVYR